VHKSAGTVDRKQATGLAKSLHDTIRINLRLVISVHADTFHACAQHLVRQQETLVATGQRDERVNTEDNKRLEADILPFFGMMDVRSITASTLDDYIADPGERKKLSSSAGAKHLIVVRKVLTEAQ
jgi:hypothetical protein